MLFNVFTASGKDFNRWSSCIDRLKPEDRDIHFLPAYGSLYQKTYGFEPYLAFYGDEGNFVIQPFVKRSLNGLPFLKEQGIDELYYDISNPYGYGGPLCLCKDHEQAGVLYKEFDRQFSQYCENQKIAAEFTSLHPLLESQHMFMRLGIVSPVLQKEVVYLDLTLTEDEMWRCVRKGHKSSIKKAMKMGVRIENAEPSPENFGIFNQLYFETMDRNKAAERWFFPQEYFSNCYDFLGKERVSLFFAYVDNIIAAGCIVMHDFDTVYYHFSGSDERFYSYCTNNLLVYEVALWARQKGYKRFHLGGGVSSSSDDPLFIFKSGFSDKKAPLYTYGRIHNKKTYEHLSLLKRKHEIAVSGKELVSGYFPLYRR